MPLNSVFTVVIIHFNMYFLRSFQLVQLLYFDIVKFQNNNSRIFNFSFYWCLTWSMSLFYFCFLCFSVSPCFSPLLHTLIHRYSPGHAHCSVMPWSSATYIHPHTHTHWLSHSSHTMPSCSHTINTLPPQSSFARSSCLNFYDFMLSTCYKLMFSWTLFMSCSPL